MLSSDELLQLTDEERLKFSEGNLTDKLLMAAGLKEQARVRAIDKGVALNGLSVEQLKALPTPGAYGSPQSAAQNSLPSRYGTARGVLAVVDALGGIMIAAGLLWLVALLVNATGHSYSSGGFTLIDLLAPVGVFVSGILILAHGQTQRATLDTADLSREILAATKALAG